jgi:hypothetical protein
VKGKMTEKEGTGRIRGTRWKKIKKQEQEKEKTKQK